MTLILDLIEDGARVEIYCAQCRTATWLTGSKLLSPWGPQNSVRAVQRRLRCKTCGMPGEIRVTWPDEAINAAKLIRGLPLHQ